MYLCYKKLVYQEVGGSWRSIILLSVGYFSFSLHCLNLIFKTLALPFFPQSTVAQNRNVYRIKKILINLKLRDKDYSFFVFPLLIKVLLINIGF